MCACGEFVSVNENVDKFLYVCLYAIDLYVGICGALHIFVSDVKCFESPKALYKFVIIFIFFHHSLHDFANDMHSDRLCNVAFNFSCVPCIHRSLILKDLFSLSLFVFKLSSFTLLSVWSPSCTLMM